MDKVHLGITKVVLQFRHLTDARNLPVLDRTFFGRQISIASNHEQIIAVVDDIVSASSSYQISRLCPSPSCQIEAANDRLVSMLVMFRLATDHEKRGAKVNDGGVCVCFYWVAGAGTPLPIV